MTAVEKAAYLKGLVEGMGIDPNSNEGKLWNALGGLLSDMAHEIEDLHAASLEHDEALDEICDELNYLEELTCDLDFPEYEDDDEDDEDDGSYGSCGCRCSCGDDYEEDEDEDDEPEYDGVIYDVTCPVCGEEISFDEDTLDEGYITCPKCGENLEFDLSDDESEDGDDGEDM